ncbi:benzoate-CoA ligase family protein [Sulfitobacter sp. CB2047]|uniref:benzoate-CoA ligase family protein n=1 Tax=unclassified Sulfitobacter TaxID=196795 RepID=UPI00056A9FB0|nr:benzoate-CoA ligase family protein [Sulfitobacter sp. CB2047]PTA97705.1 benzoate-CoA ligase family protein [Sulfitobacter sp. CB-A]ULO22209.1 benzoate-CoA ligase family protein [Sulfitobacter sp. CB2047]
MPHLSTVEIFGAGPAGLYTALLLRRYLPSVSVTVTEKNSRDATFGFGVVFSDRVLEALKADDPETYDLIVPHMERWRDMELATPSGREIIDGMGYSAIGRLKLIDLLAARAEEMGAVLRFEQEIHSPQESKADLVIGADGINSVTRAADEQVYQTTLGYYGNHFAWFGATIPFDRLTQTFVETENGAFNAHHYRYSKDRSTFIVECDEATFQNYGFTHLGEFESARVCSEIFAETLQGTALQTNMSVWRQFPRLWCDTWVSGRHVILGDAAHTAHYSIGSGTRLAMEDAFALVANLRTQGDIDVALSSFQRERPQEAKKIVEAANTSASWYEGFAEKLAHPSHDFAFDYLTRSGRMDMDRLRQETPNFMARYEDLKATSPDAIADPVATEVPGAAEIGFDKAQHANCSEMLWQNLARNPDKMAVTGPVGTLSYRELVVQASRWGNAFLRAGIKRGERIAFFLDDTPVYPAAFYGAVRAGLVPVLLNVQTKPDVLNYFLKDSGARFALVEADLAEVFDDETQEGTDLETVVIANGSSDAAKAISASDFLVDTADTLGAADTGPDDMAFWMYSSGSTGRPKGIVHLHHDMAYIQQSFGSHVLKLRESDICYSVPKAYFAYGFGNSMVFPFACGATALLVPNQPRPEAVLDAIETYEPTVLFGLPTLYTALARAKDIDSRNLSSLRQSMSAAEILSEDVYKAWKAKVGHGPTEGLGSTEMLHIYLSNKLDDHRLGAAGARVPGYEIRLETPEGQPPSEGEEGVMFVRGHSSSPTYWNRPDKTRDTMRGDWIYTGDRFIERDGYYYFQGRADDLVKVSGQWVWPLEVERCLNEHPDVHECAVLAEQLADKRTALRAIVSLVSGRRPDEAQTVALRDHIKAHLTPYKAPRIFDYVEELPKTGTGKIDRQALVRKPETAA